MIGISVTVADVKTFNSMAAKKIKGSKLASKFIKKKEKGEPVDPRLEELLVDYDEEDNPI